MLEVFEGDSTHGFEDGGGAGGVEGEEEGGGEGVGVEKFGGFGLDCGALAAGFDVVDEDVLWRWLVLVV